MQTLTSPPTRYGEGTHHVVELLHLREHRELLPCFKDLLVLSRVRLLGEWVDIPFLE